jgi:hypothetical protein
MTFRTVATTGLLALAVSAMAVAAAPPQAGEDTFTATASVKTAAGAAATAPVTIVVSRKMPQQEVDKFTAAFKTGGPGALRKALDGVPPTGSVRIGDRAPTAIRLTLERVTDKGRLLTMITDQPILFLGAGLPGAKPKAGYDFGIVDIEVDATGSGTGTLLPAAKVRVEKGAFVVDEYGSERIQLAGVKLKK